MDAELLQLKSTFSTPHIFLFCLGIDPDDFYRDERNKIAPSVPNLGHDIHDINQILLYRVMHLGEHEEIIPSPIYDKLTKRQIRKAFNTCKSIESDCSNDLLTYARHDEKNGFFFVLTRENIFEWFIKHNLDCPEVFQPIKRRTELETLNNTLEDNKEIPIDQLVKDREETLNEKQLTYNTPQNKTIKRFNSKSLILIAAAWIHTGMYKNQKNGGGYDGLKKAIVDVDRLYGLNLLKKSDNVGFHVVEGNKTKLIRRHDNKYLNDSLNSIRDSHQDYINKIITISSNPKAVQVDLDKVQN